MVSIPERAPISDSFTGLVLQYGTAQALALTPQPGAEILASGDFVIRYGVRFLGKLHQSIVPGLLVLDYGDMLTGEDAWEFLFKRSNLHPRAEIVGYRNDGSDDMVFLRTLDFAVNPAVLAYPNLEATKPLAHPTALIATVTDNLPSRLLEYLPIYASLDEWQNADI